MSERSYTASEDTALTPTAFVDSILSACDPSNWDSKLNKGAYYRKRRHERLTEPNWVTVCGRSYQADSRVHIDGRHWRSRPNCAEMTALAEIARESACGQSDQLAQARRHVTPGCETF
jgi:hypothetical protein